MANKIAVDGDVTVGGNTLSGSELGFVDGVTAGTATASKAVVVDGSKDIATLGNVTLDQVTFAVGATGINSDSGTATASSSAATLNKMAGKITSESLTTAAAAAETLTITSDKVAAADMVMCSVANGTNTQGIPMVGLVTPAAGSFTVTVENQHASEALNGTVVVSYVVVKA